MKALPDIERITLYYGACQHDGYIIDWQTGQIEPPPRQPG